MCGKYVKLDLEILHGVDNSFFLYSFNEEILKISKFALNIMLKRSRSSKKRSTLSKSEKVGLF